MSRRERRAADKRSRRAGAPAGAEALIRQGDAAAAAGRMEEAARHYGAALEARPGDALAADRLCRVHYNFGNAFRRECRLDEALAAYRHALSLSPDVPEVHNNLGITLQDLGRLDEAIGAFRRAIALKPDFAEALGNLGNALRAKGDSDEAMGALRQGLRGDEASPAAHNNLGIALLERGRLDEAAARFRGAIALDPSYPEAYLNLGNLLRIEGWLDEAVTNCRTAVALRPDYVEALNGLAVALGEQGEVAEATACLERAIEIEPGYAEAHVALGNLLLDGDRLDEAIACYRRALAIRPDHRGAAANLRKAASRQLPAWHFTMLADVARNEAFRMAIEGAVGPSSRVLDIGTGSGLLALMAARAGAAEILACESSAPLAEIAAEIVAANGYQDRIKVVNKRSTRLQPGVDLSGPADVLIAEIFDVGLLGEGVLPTLRHAVRSLAAPDAAVIPAGASVFGMLVEMPRLRAVNPVREISGFDLSAFDRLRRVGDYLNVALEAEPHRVLSTPFHAVDFDFRNPLPAVGLARPVTRTLDVVATADGVAQAVAFWFDLDLDDEITVSNRPGGDLRHWGQAVQFLDRDIPIAAGETVRLTMSRTDSQISFSSSAMMYG